MAERMELVLHKVHLAELLNFMLLHQQVEVLGDMIMDFLEDRAEERVMQDLLALATLQLRLHHKVITEAQGHLLQRMAVGAVAEHLL
jgi:hypothetical protein